MHRLTLNLLAAVALALPSIAAPAQSVPVQLIGYGTLRAEFFPSGATFLCQDEQHADALLGKLRADYTWDHQSGVRPIQLPNGAPALQLPDAGPVLVLLRLGSTVRALTAPNPQAAADLMRSIPIPSTAVYEPIHPYPASLDYFDLNAVRISVTALKPNILDKGPNAYTQQALAQEASIWSKLHIGMGANVRSFFATNNRIDGPPHTFPMDYEIELARKAGESVNVWFGPAGGPWWFRNLFPEQVDRSESIWGWQKAPSAQGAVYPGLTMNDAARAYVDRNDLDLLHNIQAVAGDSLASIRIATGRPGDEMAFHGFSNELMNRSPADFQGFRQWLQSTRHLDLAALGNRWFGDPAHYRSWTDVTPPSIYEFFGDFGKDTFDLDHDWLWRPEDSPSEQQAWSSPTYQPASDWTTIDLAPSERQLLLLSGTREAMQHGATNPDTWWFRKQFSASAWLSANHGKPVYLVVEANTVSRNPIQIYLNGSNLALTPPTPDSRGWIALDITSHLLDGTNLLALRLSRDAVIRGHVFLTTTQPRGYPYLGPQANARWIDLRDWLADKIIDGYARIAAPVLAENPNVPVLLVPGSDWSSANRFLPLKLSSGFSAIHDTGSEASYRPHMPALGYVIGTYASSEESNTTDDPQRLSQELAWFLLNGVSEHNYVPNADVYLPVEQKTQWFSHNARLLQLLGKALWVKPSIAIMRSSTNELYLPNTNFVYAWDLGRGDLQATHRNNVYVTEAELKAGLADPYPVLIDANSVIMDPGTVAAIERYVRAGGTFIAVPGSGRNDPLHPDTWPISSLTGFKVLGERGHQTITIDPANPIFRAFAGKTFPGEGYGGPSIALEPQAPGTTAIAHWQDGSVAIGLRTLGKGRVIVLGSTFWRTNSRPTPSAPSLQTAFLNDLLAGLNIQPEIDSDSDRIWTRREITKNGLADWIFAYNPDLAQPQSAVTLSFPQPQSPARVYDAVTGATVPFTYRDGRVIISALDLAPNQLRVFAVDRNDLPNALQTWYAEKVKYWRRTDPQPAFHALPRPAYSAIVFDKLRFRTADPSALTHLNWQQESTSTAAWKDAGFGFWDEMGYPAQGVGLYRTEFNLPASAATGRFNFGLVSFDTPVFYGDADIYLNGRKILSYKQHYWSNFETAEVTGLVHPGLNQLAVVVQTHEGRGGYIGQMALYPLQTLDDQHEIRDWNLFQSNTASAPAPTPIQATGYFVRSQAAIPAAWAGRSIYLELSSSSVSPCFVLLNGHVLSLNQGHPVGGVFQTNISAWAKPGQINQLEIWPFSSAPFAYEPVSKSRITLERVTLGVTPAGTP